MLPQKLLRASAHLEGTRIVPHYFGARDEPWLAALIAEYRRFVGEKRAALHERLREPLPVRAPKAKLQIAIFVLDGCSRDLPRAAVPPKEARAALFRGAAQGIAARAALLATVAESFAVTAVELEQSLFADLRSERQVAALSACQSPSQLVSQANLAIVLSLVRRAVRVKIVVRGSARALVRHARARGLIGRAAPLVGATDGVVLDVSGPFSLFRHSEIYGRALVSLVPPVLRADGFELTASCALGPNGEHPSFVVRSGDPVAASHPAPDPELRVNRRFERDFRRTAPDWQLTREPPALVCGALLIFPDFELAPRSDPRRSWLLEIVGFWTPRYLREKLERLRAAGIERFLLCIDEQRGCGEEEPPAEPGIIRYEARLNPAAVLAIVDPDARGRTAAPR